MKFNPIHASLTHYLEACANDLARGMQVSMSVNALRTAVQLINELPVTNAEPGGWLHEDAMPTPDCFHELCDPIRGMYRSACGNYVCLVGPYCGNCGRPVVLESLICWTEDVTQFPVGKKCNGKIVTRTKLYGSLWCVWGR